MPQFSSVFDVSRRQGAMRHGALKAISGYARSALSQCSLLPA
jgi:hypothetical protein